MKLTAKNVYVCVWHFF